MKNLQFQFVCTLFALYLFGCTSIPLNGNAEKVVIVDSISASDMLNYDHVADLQSTGLISIENCRNDLRNQAADRGATIVRVSSTESAFCGLDGLSSKAEKKCFAAHGVAFKPKSH